MLEPLPPVNAQLQALPPLEALRSPYNFHFQLDDSSEPKDPILAAILSAERVHALPQRPWLPPVDKRAPSVQHKAEDPSPSDDIWDRARREPAAPKVRAWRFPVRRSSLTCAERPSYLGRPQMAPAARTNRAVVRLGTLHAPV